MNGFIALYLIAYLDPTIARSITSAAGRAKSAIRRLRIGVTLKG